MEENKKDKTLIVIILLLGIIVILLGGFIAYDKIINPSDECETVKTSDNPKDDDKKKDDESIKYETMKDDEIKKYLEDSKLFYKLNRQESSINDMKKFLEEDKVTLLEDALYYLCDEDNYDQPITPKMIEDFFLDRYGYILDYDYNNTVLEEDIPFEWDNSKKQYMFVGESLYRQNFDNYEMKWDIKKIEKNPDNTYDVTTRQLWSEPLEGVDDYPTAFYFSYYDASTKTSPVITYTDKEVEKIGYGETFNNAFKDIDNIEDGGYYIYRLIKENGNIRIIKYTIK